MRALVVGGSSTWPASIDLTRYDLCVAADSGAEILLDYNQIPTAVIGDFDSLSEESKSKLMYKTQFYRYPKDKNWSDLILAIRWALRRGAQAVDVVGWDDHAIEYALGAFFELHEQEASKVEFLGLRSQGRVMAVGEWSIEPGLECSFFPLGVCLAQSENLRWNFAWKISLPNQRSLRNQSFKGAKLVIKQGLLLMISRTSSRDVHSK